jgi:protein fantom
MPEDKINDFFRAKTMGHPVTEKSLSQFGTENPLAPRESGSSSHLLAPPESSFHPLAPDTTSSGKFGSLAKTTQKPTPKGPIRGTSSSSMMQRKKTRPNTFDKLSDKEKTDIYFQLQEENMKLKKDHQSLENSLMLMKTNFSKLEKNVKHERELAETYTGKDFKASQIEAQTGLDTLKAENKMLLQENKILIKAALTGNLNKQLLSRIEGPTLNKFNMKPKILSGAVMFDIKREQSPPPLREPTPPVRYVEEKVDLYKPEYDRIYAEFLELKARYNLELEKNRELEERLKNQAPVIDNSQELFALREKCKTLERQLADALNSPFLKDDSRLKALMIEITTHKERGLKLDSSLVELAERLKSMTFERDKYKEELLVLQARLSVKDNYMKEFETQLRNIGGMDLNAFMKALGLMKLRGDEPAWSQLNFLEEGTAIPSDLQGLRREIERLKLEKGQLAAEVEKAQSLLVLRNEMEKEKTSMYETEVEQLRIQLRSAQQRAEELARLADYRANRVIQLERNTRLNTYDGDNRIVGTKTQITVGELQNSAPEFLESGTEVAANENILDLWLGEAEFYQSALETALRGQVSVTSSFLSFLTVDFYNMETQSTSLCESLRPKYNVHISFKISVNDAFIKTLQNGYIYLEGHASRGDSHVTFARAQIPLNELLTRVGAISELNTKTGIVDSMVVLVSNFDGKTSIGSQNFKMRMRHPLSEAMRWYREKEEIVELANPKQFAMDTIYSYSGPTRTRELIATVFKCMSLKGQTYPGNLRPFVCFQFFTEADVYTPISVGPDPVFDQTFKFSLITTGDLKKYLDSETLEIYVFDDNAPIREGGQDLIGTAKVPLNALLLDTAIEGTYLLYNLRGAEAGRLTLRIAWKDSKTDEIGYGTPLTQIWEKESYERIARALSARGLGLESGFKVFDQDQDGLISPQEFRNTILITLRLPLSEQEVQLLINACNLNDGGITRTTFRQKLAGLLPSDRVLGKEEKPWEENVIDMVRKRIQEKGLNLKDAFAAFDENKDGIISAAEFIRAFRIMQLGLNDSEIELILRYFDTSHDGKVNYKEFCEKIENRAGSWEEKTLDLLRKRIREKNLNVRQTFDAFDENKDGMISRPEFVQTFKIMQLGLSQEDVERLFQYFDPNRDMRINFNEFCDRLEGKTTSSGTAEERILSLVRRRISEKNLSLKQAFAAFDEDSDGTISREEFLKAFQIMKLGVNEADVLMLFNYFDPRRTGRIVYQVFFEKISEGASSAWEEEMIDKVRTRIREKRLSLQQSFNAFDENKDGKISLAEFLKAFKIMDLGVSDSDVRRLFSYFEQGSSGIIDYRVFSERINSSRTESSLRTSSEEGQSERLTLMIRQRIQENGLTFKKAFEGFDENKDGNISRAEFIKAFKIMKFAVDEAEIIKLFNTFDENRTGTIDYREFINRIQGISRRPTIRGENMEQRIIELVKTRISEKNLSLRQAFIAFDENKDGQISQVEFLKAFRIMELGVNENEVIALFRHFDENRTGTIDYREFCNHIQGVSATSSSNFQRTGSSGPFKALDSIIEQIRRRIKEKNLSLKQAFLAFDENGDGKINENEFLKTLQAMELGVSDNDARNLFSSFDRNRTGTIDYREFVDRVQQTAGQKAASFLEDDLVEKIRERIKQKNLSIRQAFLAFDENKDGTISKTEFIKAFRIMDLGVTEIEVERLFNSLDKQRSGSIDYRIFCNTIQEIPIKSPSPQPFQSPSPSPPSQEFIDRVISQLQQRIVEKRLSLRQAFLAFDENRDGKISRQEFLKTFQMMQLGVSNEDIVRVFDSFDERKLGVIDYNLFCDKIQQAGSVKSSPGENWEENILEAVRKRIKEKNLSIRQAFLAFDENRDGMISSKEFVKAFQIMELGIPDPDVLRIFNNFDPRRTGNIDYRVFCDRLQAKS